MTKTYCLEVTHLIRNKFFIQANKKSIDKIKKQLSKEDCVIGFIILEEDS